MKTRRQFVKSALIAGVSTVVLPSITNVAHADDPVLGAIPQTIPHLTSSGIAPKSTIDWHNHWVSPGVIEVLKTRKTAPYATTNADGTVNVINSDAASGEPRPLQAGFTDINLRIKHLDQVGVDHQVISWATTSGWDAILSADDAKPIWTAFNNDLSALTKQYPDRFSGYAALTTADIDWSASELERAYTQLGLIGAVLPVGAFQSLEALKRLTPIFEVTQKYKGHLYIHSGPASPSIPDQITLHTPPDDAPGVRYDFEWASTYARGATSLTQTGFLDSYPDVTVQIAMLGGFTPFLAAISEVSPPADGSSSPIDKLRRVYLDASTARAPHTLDLAVQTIGADRILFGSDFPIVTIDKSIIAVNDSVVTDSDKQQIFVETGQKLFNQIKQNRSSTA